MSRSLAPFTQGVRLRWEVDFDETPFKLWRSKGFPPPLPDSEAE